jgi:protein-L-isoaspartate(D-aspartate) O-methyltransferase
MLGMPPRQRKPFVVSNVLIVNGDGRSAPFDAADVIYINAGMTRPVVSWLERLTDDGPISPMPANQGFRADDPTNETSGAAFQIERRPSQFSV